MPALTGDKDMSLPVWDVDAHMIGPDNDWLFPVGGFPSNLRPGGWIYLRIAGRLEARVRVSSIGFRSERVQHTGPPEGRGAGPTIEVDAATWQRVSIDLGDLAKTQRQGYRYLITGVDGSVTHLSYTASIPDGLVVDPAHAPDSARAA